jgi:hypothetical protein
MKEASGSKDKGQASGRKKLNSNISSMYIINLNFNAHKMLMYNIISKVLQFQDLR